MTDSSKAPPARRTILVELLVVAALAAAFLVAFQARPGYVDVALAVVAVAFISLATRRSSLLWQSHCGEPSPYRVRLSRAARAAALLTVPALAVLLAVGVGAGFAAGGWSGAAERIGGWHLVAAMLLYLPWALLQQFVFQFYLLGRLLAVLPVPGAVGLTALAFSSVHFPRAPVMAVTLLAGAAWALLYRRYRTIVPLAVSHALLGSALHYWVFGRDLLAGWLALR